VTRPIYQIKAEFLKALAHPIRIRTLELLSEGERAVGELVKEIGVEPSNLSQQLGVLRTKGIVTARREGSNVYYSAKDPRIFQLLAVAKEILTTSLKENQGLLDELESLTFEAETAEAVGD
jgi:DNA-binding transcriptional ArsR family regulator